MRSRGDTRGFTLVELGVVLGVIAVLALVLISAKFFIDSAKIGSTVQMVNSVRQASRAYAKRVCGGIGFACAGSPAVSIAALQAQNLLPGPPNGAMCSPWCGACNPPAVCGVGVVPRPPQNTNIQIGVCVGQGGNISNDAIAALGQVGAAAAGGPCGGCPAGSTCVSVTTR